MKFLIVDDEPLARVRMRKLLAEAKENAEIDDADCADEALKKILEDKPFAVFLDIQMPGKGGFEIVEEIADNSEKYKHKPFVVFVTAFDDYAIKAFEKNAVDYLLKPVDTERLAKTIEKLEYIQKTREPSDILYEKLRNLVENRQQVDYLQRIQVRVGDRTLLIPVGEIVRFESDEKYTAVYTTDNRYIIDATISYLEEKLDPSKFVRIQRANLVAINQIAEIRRSFPGRVSVILKDTAKTAVPVGRNYMDKLKNL
ncbi:DNA-binding response regulator [Fibrobacterales bacterium]|nr:DNA-binding response regulator [Fibrobacterales bacterium]